MNESRGIWSYRICLFVSVGTILKGHITTPTIDDRLGVTQSDDSKGAGKDHPRLISHITLITATPKPPFDLTITSSSA